MSNGVVRNSRRYVAYKTLGAVIVWIQQRLSAKHLRDGFPQLAVFSFDHIGIRINANGRYERDELDALIAFLRSKELLGGACIDVGANIGNHSVFFADYYDRVYSFEPNPLAYKLLEINALLRKNITCFNFGLSRCEHQAQLVSPPGNIGESSLVVDSAVRETVCENQQK